MLCLAWGISTVSKCSEVLIRLRRNPEYNTVSGAREVQLSGEKSQNDVVLGRRDVAYMGRQLDTRCKKKGRTTRALTTPSVNPQLTTRNAQGSVEISRKTIAPVRMVLISNKDDIADSPIVPIQCHHVHPFACAGVSENKDPLLLSIP